MSGLSRVIDLVDAEEVAHCLSKILGRWPRVPAGEVAEAGDRIKIERVAKGYRLASPWLEAPVTHRHPVDIACALVVELARDYVAEHPETLCLHGASALFGAGLVVFPNRYRAGKSVLSACLAAHGRRLFGDDILPIVAERNEAMALGVAPRLRLPLPETLDERTVRFIEKRRGCESARYSYLDLSEQELAPFGTLAPIRGFVLLDRQPEGAAELLPVSVGDVLRAVVWQNFARYVAPDEILGRLHALVAEARCYRLRYARAEDALPLLDGAFAAAAEERPAADGTPSPSYHPRPVSASPRSGSGRFRRTPAVAETRVDGDIFLTNPETGTIHHLNSVGAALWCLLEEAADLEEVVACLCLAFPDVGEPQIRADAETLIDGLTRSGLIQEPSQPERVEPSSP